MDGVEFFGSISFLKAGLNYATHVTTVSPTYAEEITRPEFGCGLDGRAARAPGEGRLTGIVNGIEKSWDPRGDKRCPYLFDPQRWKGRYADFVRGVSASASRAPLFAFVARLVHQKGVDLVLRGGEYIVERGGQIVVVGRGEPHEERACRAGRNISRAPWGARIGFDPEEARAVFAGADFLLMPSRFDLAASARCTPNGSARCRSRIARAASPRLFTTARRGCFSTAPISTRLTAAFGERSISTPRRRSFRAMRRAAMALIFDWSDSAAQLRDLYRELERGAGRRLHADASPRACIRTQLAAKGPPLGV